MLGLYFRSVFATHFVMNIVALSVVPRVRTPVAVRVKRLSRLYQMRVRILQWLTISPRKEKQYNEIT